MKLFLPLILIVVVGCTNGNDQISPDKTDEYHYGMGAKIITVDSCEYVLFVGANSGDIALVHSGNCHNPNHQKPKP